MINTNDYKEWFQWPIDDLTVGRIKAVVSEAVIRKGTVLRIMLIILGRCLGPRGWGCGWSLLVRGLLKCMGTNGGTWSIIIVVISIVTNILAGITFLFNIFDLSYSNSKLIKI